MWSSSVPYRDGFLGHCLPPRPPFTAVIIPTQASEALSPLEHRKQAVKREELQCKGVFVFSFQMKMGHFVGIQEIARHHVCFYPAVSNSSSKSRKLPVASRTDMMANIEDVSSKATSCFIAEKQGIALGTVGFVLLKESQKIWSVGCHLNSAPVLLTPPHLGKLRC